MAMVTMVSSGCYGYGHYGKFWMLWLWLLWQVLDTTVVATMVSALPISCMFSEHIANMLGLNMVMGFQCEPDTNSMHPVFGRSQIPEVQCLLTTW